MSAKIKFIIWTVAIMLLATPVVGQIALSDNFKVYAYPLTADTDGDGVEDVDDIDADNDGIINSVDCPMGADCVAANQGSYAEITDYTSYADVASGGGTFYVGSPAGSACSAVDITIGLNSLAGTAAISTHGSVIDGGGLTIRPNVGGTVSLGIVEVTYTASSPIDFRLDVANIADGSETVKFQDEPDVYPTSGPYIYTPGTGWANLNDTTPSTFEWLNTNSVTMTFETSTSFVSGQRIYLKNYPVYTGPCDGDADEIAGYIDLDSDNDGIADIYEAGNPAVAAYDINGNGTIDPVGEGFVDDGVLANSAGGNGLDDRIENIMGASGFGVTPVDSFDTAGDSAADWIDLDSDDDGIPDATEARTSTDYTAYPAVIDTAADSDDDGVLDIYDSDGAAVAGATTFGSTLSGFKTGLRTPNDDADDTDSLPDFLDTDSDGDGILDSDPEESGTITGVSLADPDGSVDNPLSSGTLDNDDEDASGADVDFRSIDNPLAVDLNTPTIIISSANEAAYPVAGSCSQDGDEITIIIKGVDVTPAPTPTCSGVAFSFNVDASTIPDGGPYDIVATVSDDAGVLGDVDDTESISADTTLPTITIDTPVDAFAINETAYPLTGTCTEDGDTVVVTVSDGDNLDVTATPNPVTCSGGAYSVTADVSSLDEGPFDIVADITDAAGNTGQDQVSQDSDNITTAEELNAPNGGDVNGDGVPDAEQANVASYINPNVDGYVSTEAIGECSSIVSVSSHNELSLGALDSQFEYSIGLHGVDLTCGTLGGSATITHFWDQEYDVSSWVYRKFINNTYIDFNSQVTYGTATVGTNTVTTVTFTLTDGGPFDADGLVNGIIVDPAGPAVQGAESLADTGAGTEKSVYMGAAIMIASLMLGIAAKPLKNSRK